MLVLEYTLRTLIELSKKDLRNKKVVIFCDNRSAVLAISRQFLTSGLLLQIANLVKGFELLGATVDFVWLPAHQPIEALQRIKHLRMNEIADKLTRDENASETIWNVPTTRQELKRKLYKKAMRNVYEKWQITDIFYPKKFRMDRIARNKWVMARDSINDHRALLSQQNPFTYPDLTHLSRANMFKITALFTNFNFLRGHMSRFTECSDICRGCHGGRENSLHVAEFCPAYARARVEIFGSSIIRVEDMNCNVTDFIRFINKSNLSAKLTTWNLNQYEDDLDDSLLDSFIYEE